ncbi:transcriptional regulator [Clostridium sp. BJN0001]|uniref:transcriptional regulator n=1 Tax=Clostridium sp. BJN0001 TaxID=2930219 RepID=UPI001FD47F78|nr:transcriptional regulator [Clostridium sp. BJN0001]
MDIYSVGEKIRRIRIFKNITLKKLCGTKISIAKMSCIENDKVKADKDILKYISQKLEIDYDYLIQDSYDQIKSNIEEYKKNFKFNLNLESELKDNYDYAIKYKYYDLAFELMHMLFKYYIENNMIKNVQVIISGYYNLYQKNNSNESTFIYYNDMGEFLIETEEYKDAIIYYEKIDELCEKNSYKLDFVSEIDISYKKAVCYQNLSKYETAFSILKPIINDVEKLENTILKTRIYQKYSELCILLNSDESLKFKEKSYSYIKNDKISIIYSKLNYAKYYFISYLNDQAVIEINEARDILKDLKSEETIPFNFDFIKLCLKYKEYNMAYDIIETTIDDIIITQNRELIENIYYLKSRALENLKKYEKAEKYMNLSLDILMKFGNREQRKKRYLDLGELYYKMGNVKDSLKYFNLTFTI